MSLPDPFPEDVEMTLNLPFLDYISRRYEGE
jgi:hypothetical protein